MCVCVFAEWCVCVCVCVCVQGYVCVDMGSQHTTARLGSAILGSGGRGGSMGSSRREWQHTAPCETEVLDPSWVLDGESKLDYSRPDAIHGSCWVEQKGSASMLKDSTTNSDEKTNWV